MNRTKERKRRMKRRMVRKRVWRCTFCLLGALVLLMIWNVTTFAIRCLSPEEKKPGGVEAETEYTFAEAEEPSGSESPGLSDENLLLVNKDHPLDSTYKPELMKMKAYGAQVDASIYGALEDMLEDGNKEGLTFWIASSYRSMDRQRELLDEDIAALVRQGFSYSQAYEEVTKETMPVGCSEHATGLAVDIVAKDYQHLDAGQAETDEILWLQKNCSRYGFILRYPEGKEDITKVSYESWHFRYVGRDAAKTIMEQGITLEEYLGLRE